MSRTKKLYNCGRKRCSNPINPPRERQPKDYHAQAIMFHGGEANWEKAMERAKSLYAK